MVFTPVDNVLYRFFSDLPTYVLHRSFRQTYVCTGLLVYYNVVLGRHPLVQSDRVLSVPVLTGLLRRSFWGRHLDY